MSLNPNFFLSFNNKQKFIINFIVDIFLSLLSFFIANLLIYANLIINDKKLLSFLLIFIVLNSLISLVLKTYSSIRRFLTSHLLLNILIKNILLFILFVFLYELKYLGFISLFFFFFLFFSFTAIIVFPIIINLKNFNLRSGINILIYGAGETGFNAFNKLVKNKSVLAYIDDDPTKVGRYVNGTKVYSNIDIKSLINSHNIKEIYIAIPSLSSKEEELLIRKIKKVSNIKIYIHNKNDESDFSFNELKNSFKSNILNENYPKYLNKKSILITGAAGSIGEEICFQVLDYNIKSLIIIDSSENKLAWLKKSIDQKKIKGIKIKYYLLSILDKLSIKEIIKDNKPNVIFHAAAYKHVDIVEENHSAGAKNNIVGLANILNNCSYKNLETFVFISSDKAVNPSNIMGMTKRVGEIMVNSMNKIHKKKKFISVRFGNVIGSSGSLFEIFKNQIDNRNPLTVTHKDATRYFMTIYDAINLVIFSPQIKTKAKILVLNMGSPIKILDIAKKLININFKKNKIKYIGLRPGEKIHEELFHSKHRIETENNMIYGENLDIFYSLSAINKFVSKIESQNQMIKLNLKKTLKDFYKF